jgi:hypothetical protein
MHRGITVTLLVLVMAVPAAAQTLTEQLQKGVYTEETAGDVTEAARIYQQVADAPRVPHEIAQEAQRRLLALAIQQARGAASPAAARHAAASQLADPLATITNGRYRHRETGIQFDLPAGWIAGQTRPSSDDGQMVTLRDPASGMAISVWMVSEQETVESATAKLALAPALQRRQRLGVYAIFGARPGSYTLTEERIQPRTINGRRAVLAVGTYTFQGATVEVRERDGTIERWRIVDDPSGPLLRRGWYRVPDAAPAPGSDARVEDEAVESMVEYMTWIYTEQSKALFFSRVPADTLGALRPHFERLVSSAVIP